MIQQAETDATLLGWLCPSGPTSGLEEFGCLLATYEVPVLLVAAVVVGAAARFTWLWFERRKAARTPLLVFPLSGAEGMDPVEAEERRRKADAARRERARTETGQGADPAGAESPAPSPTLPVPAELPPAQPTAPSGLAQAPAPPPPQPPVAPPAEPHARGVAPPSPAPTSPPQQNGSGARPAPAPAVAVSGGAMEGTLQLLPGRLELLEGGGAGMAREVRFVRVPGRDPEVTFGREEGDPFLHVRLNLPTVSRRQARLRFRDGRWTLHNESHTNPTLVSGDPLSPDGPGRVLNDGDRIEMGTVIYRFHQPGATSERKASEEGLTERSSWFTDQGRRPSNQDAVAVRTLPDGRELAVICDGIGSNSNGRIASHLALDTLVATLEGGADLQKGVHAAHRAIRTRIEEDPELEGMGTTLVAVLRHGGRYELANVGDSRAYRLDGEGITCLTRDHSFAAEVRREGTMSEEELARSPWRHAITRHLGAEGELEVDVFGRFEALEAHVLVLCSDGLHGTLDDETVARLTRRSILAEGGVRDVARTLGEEALRQGADDNVSAVALTFRPWGRKGDAVPAWLDGETG